MIPLEKNSKICLIGDSLTEHGFWEAGAQLLLSKHIPDKKVYLVNAAVGGDTAGGAVKRFEYDIAPKKAQYSFILFNINDIKREFYKPGLSNEEYQSSRSKIAEIYENNIRTLIKMCQDSGSKVILGTPIPCMSNSNDKYNIVEINRSLALHARIIIKIAKELSLPVIDIHKELTTLFANNSKFESLCFGQDNIHVVKPDGVHFSIFGHDILSRIFVNSFIEKQLAYPMTICEWKDSDLRLNDAALHFFETEEILRGVAHIRYDYKLNSPDYTEDEIIADIKVKVKSEKTPKWYVQMLSNYFIWSNDEKQLFERLKSATDSMYI